MNPDQILDLFNGTKDQYVAEAIQSRRAFPGKNRVSKGRLALLAAVLSLMLLLVGCAAVYLWLNDRSIGQETYTQRFDREGHYIEPVEKTADVVTLFGPGGSGMQKAMAQWLKFRQSCLPEWDLNLTEEDYAQLPDRYKHVYNCYTPEMVEELDRIAETYGLLLLDQELAVLRCQYETALEGLGLTSLLRTNAQATMEEGQGSIYAPRNFYFEFTLDMTGVDAPWARDIFVTYGYGDRNYFPSFGVSTLDLTQYQQWKYASADGTDLMLALDPKGKGIILAEGKEGMILIEVDSNFTGPNFPGAEDVMDREGLQQLADAFDYAIDPKPVDTSALQAKLDADYDAYTQSLMADLGTRGGFAEYLLEEGHRFAQWNYAFHDFDGDGTREMLLKNPAGDTTNVLHEFEGAVREHPYFQCDIRPLEDGGYLYVSMPYVEGDGFRYDYREPMVFDYSLGGGETAKLKVGLVNQNGTWETYTDEDPYGKPITEAEAQAIIASYPEKTLSWEPLWDYAMDESGTTLGEVLSQRKNPATFQEGLAFYAQAIGEEDVWLRDSTHFALADVDGDGFLDLLLSPDGKEVWPVYRCRYGKAVQWMKQISYLCEDGTMAEDTTIPARDGADLQYYLFQRFTSPTTLETLAELQCNLANGQWTDLLTGASITEAQAQAAISQYTPVALEMHPIRELIG